MANGLWRVFVMESCRLRAPQAPSLINRTGWIEPQEMESSMLKWVTQTHTHRRKNQDAKLKKKTRKLKKVLLQVQWRFATKSNKTSLCAFVIMFFYNVSVLMWFLKWSWHLGNVLFFLRVWILKCQAAHLRNVGLQARECALLTKCCVNDYLKSKDNYREEALDRVSQPSNLPS